MAVRSSKDGRGGAKTLGSGRLGGGQEPQGYPHGFALRPSSILFTMMYYDDDVDHSYAKDAPMGAARTLGVTRHPPSILLAVGQ